MIRRFDLVRRVAHGARARVLSFGVRPTRVALGGLAVLAALALFPVPLSAQPDSTRPAPTPLTAHDVARIRIVTETRIAPDGNRAAYVLSIPRRVGHDENGAAWTELHVWDFKASQLRPFITGPVNVGTIRWTADGRGIGMLAKRGSDKETSLYVIPADGGEARRIAGFKTGISDYAFHPDGKRVALLAATPVGEDRKKLDEQGLAPIVFEEEPRHVRVWMADMDPETDDTFSEIDLPGTASAFRWSPDGERFVVALAPSPGVDDEYMRRRLHLVDAATGKIVAKIANPGKLGTVQWSPDGRRIAFLSGEDLNDPSEGRLMVADASDGSFREVMKDYLPNIESFAWRNATSILYVADDGCLTSIGEVDPENGARREWIAPGGPILSGLSLDTLGANASLVGSAPDHPGELFHLSIGDSATSVRCTHSNVWLGDRSLAPQEIVRYQAGDGETVEGVLVRPLGEEPGKKYPLILAVHGGPEAHVANGWVTSYSNPGQVAAGQRMAVFYPNYRGSTGRGVAFAKAHQADYGGREFNDLIDGIDHLIAAGLVDEGRVGVTGGSYGGYATAWCSTYHSERFAAGVMFVGISDHISKSGTTDIPDEMYLVHARKRLWEDWRFFLERSPIYHVQKARTPLLILHGRDDTRVPPSQSMELYRHLKTLDQTPVRLIQYPGEGHGNRKAGARLDYNLRMIQWMRHYLIGPGGKPPPPALNYVQ